MEDLVSGENKFIKINQEPTEVPQKQLKKKNITVSNRAENSVKFKKREGHYEHGSLYGNPKFQ